MYDDIKFTGQEFNIILQARAILNKYAASEKQYFSDTSRSKEFARVQLDGYQREVFMVIFLNHDLSLITHDIMFMGSLNNCVVDPVEIVRRALILNASSVIIAHNHPTGHCEPSEDDKKLTIQIQEKLNLFNIWLVDHIIVGKSVFSFLVNGLLLDK